MPPTREPVSPSRNSPGKVLTAFAMFCAPSPIDSVEMSTPSVSDAQVWT